MHGKHVGLTVLARNPRAAKDAATLTAAPYLPTPAILPAITRYDEDGNAVEVIPAQPCPEVLTEDEAVRYLRLDLIDVKDPTDTLRYYRKAGLLRATQLGKAVRYRRVELDRFLEKQTEDNLR